MYHNDTLKAYTKARFRDYFREKNTDMLLDNLEILSISFCGNL